MRALIAAAAGSFLCIIPANADEQSKGKTFPAFSEDLLHFPGCGGCTASGPATITIHRGPGGNVTDITIQDSASGSLVQTGSANAAAGLVADPLSRFTFAAPGWAIASYLDFSSFGAWVTSGPSGFNVAGAFAGGRATPPHAMPKMGVATYSGQTFGLGVESAPTLQLPIFIWGDVSVTADFAHWQVATSLTNLMSAALAVGTGFNVIGTPTPLGALSGTASLNANTYTGTVSGNLAGLSGPIAVAGPIRGTFFGPKAQETAGTWSVAGTSTSPILPQAFGAIGSFGAVKQ